MTDEDVQRLDLTPTDGDRNVPVVGDILNKPIFGPRLLAMIGWMKSGAHCSYSTIETYMEDVLQVPVSRGYLARLCTGLISDSLDDSFFRFMFADGVEPTNNHNEQQIRQCVIDRMITQGTRSEVGQRYHERMCTALATCRKQQPNFFEFLKSSIEAKLSKRPARSLLNG